MVPPGMLRRNSLWIILKGFQLIISIHWGAWNSIRHDCFYCFGLKDTMNISTKWRKFQWLVHPLRSAAIFIFTWKKCWYIKILKNDYFFRAKMFLRHEFLFKQMEIKLFCDFFLMISNHKCILQFLSKNNFARCLVKSISEVLWLKWDAIVDPIVK